MYIMYIRDIYDIYHVHMIYYALVARLRLRVPPGPEQSRDRHQATTADHITPTINNSIIMYMYIMYYVLYIIHYAIYHFSSYHR